MPEGIFIASDFWSLVSSDPQRLVYKNGKVLLEKSFHKESGDTMWIASLERNRFVWELGKRMYSPEIALEALYTRVKNDLSRRAEDLREAEGAHLQALADMIEVTRFWKEEKQEND